MATFTQANEPRFTFKIAGTELMVADLTVSEQISRPFEALLSLASEDEIHFDDTVGKPALLTMENGDADRYVHGVVDRFIQNGINGRFYLYQARVVPQIELLSLEQDCRIFQDKKVPEIVEEVLAESGVTSDLLDVRLQRTYASRDYCVQYRETDLDFISRLLEEEGIFYFFEHSQEKHVMVLGDGTVNYQPIAGQAQVVFNPGGAMVAVEEAVVAFHLSKQIRPGKYTVRDFNFKSPSLELTADNKDTENTKLEIYDYAAGHQTPEAGKAIAKVRLQQVMMNKERAEGHSVVPRFIPGFTFTLSDHPMDAFNQEYLLVGMVHNGAQPQVLAEKATSDRGTSYDNTFMAVPSAVTIRPERSIHKPLVEGVQTAIVTGPSGEEIYTDEHGRVKVQFHWDRLGGKDEKSSCWIRVSQSWAGAGWGAMHIPRIGQEVIVDFIEGDPDRPIITGRVYHGTNTPPYPLPDEKTKSTIKSDSSKGGGGSNEFRFEDKKGSEEVYIHGQKDWTIAIENDKNQSVGNNETLQVASNRTKSVGADQSETIGSNKTIQVGANHTESIGSNMTVTVAANKSETVGVNSAETIGAAKALTIGAAYQVTVGAAMNETVGAAKAEEVGAHKTVAVGGNVSEAIGGSRSLSLGKDSDINIGGKQIEKVGKEHSLDAKKIQFTAKDQITLKTGKAEIIMKKNGDITIKGKKISIKGSGDVIIKGSKIKEN